MLVLARLPNESFLVGHDIKVTVIEVRGNKVRIGIEAPQNVPVHREEVYMSLYPKEERKDVALG